MNIKVGNTLNKAKEERKLTQTQTEMAELLDVSTSTYSRLERNETSTALEQAVNFTNILQLPIQDFLPDTMSINHTNNQNGQVGFVIGNYYSYGNDQETAKKNQELEEKVKLLETRIKDLEEIIVLMKKK